MSWGAAPTLTTTSTRSTTSSSASAPTATSTSTQRQPSSSRSRALQNYMSCDHPRPLGRNTPSSRRPTQLLAPSTSTSTALSLQTSTPSSATSCFRLITCSTTAAFLPSSSSSSPPLQKQNQRLLLHFDLHFQHMPCLATGAYCARGFCAPVANWAQCMDRANGPNGLLYLPLLECYLEQTPA